MCPNVILYSSAPDLWMNTSSYTATSALKTMSLTASVVQKPALSTTSLNSLRNPSGFEKPEMLVVNDVQCSSDDMLGSRGGGLMNWNSNPNSPGLLESFVASKPSSIDSYDTRNSLQQSLSSFPLPPSCPKLKKSRLNGWYYSMKSHNKGMSTSSEDETDGMGNHCSPKNQSNQLESRKSSASQPLRNVV